MVILTINGKGNRFLSKGILTPKFLLMYQDVTIVENILLNIKNGFNVNEKIYIGLNKAYEKYLYIFKEISNKLNLDTEIILLGDSSGQADTVKMILENINSLDQSFWIFNCDTIVKNDWENINSTNDILVEVFKSNLPYYSYIDNLENVNMIAEKKVISNFASTGNYYFKSSSLFLKLYREIFSSILNRNPEIFVSDVINYGIEQDLTVKGHEVNDRLVKVLGTPEQYEKHI